MIYLIIDSQAEPVCSHCDALLCRAPQPLRHFAEILCTRRQIRRPSQTVTMEQLWPASALNAQFGLTKCKVGM